MLILLGWLSKKYLKRWINRHTDNKYYVVTPNSAERSLSLMGEDNVYEEIMGDQDTQRLERVEIDDSPYNTINRANLPLAEISRQSITDVQVHPTGISSSQLLSDALSATISICADDIEVDGKECVNGYMEPVEVETKLTAREGIEAEMVVGVPDHQSTTDNSLSSREASQDTLLSKHSTVEEVKKLSGLKDMDKDETSLMLSNIYSNRTTSSEDVSRSTSQDAVENMEDSLAEMESNSLWNVSDCSLEDDDQSDLKHTNLYDRPPSRSEEKGEGLNRSESPVPAHTHDPISTTSESPKTAKISPSSRGSQRDAYVNCEMHNPVSSVTSDMRCDELISDISSNVNNSNSTESGGVLLDEFGYLIIEDKDHETLPTERESMTSCKNSRHSPSGDNQEKTDIDEEVEANIDEFGYLILEDVSQNVNT
ncbi:uncharacterized protein [Diadema antillarum]|uniref:uncharacterized protein n=1 Tax=Diadema antillarum TaxID=105358 RepID=UPI003A847FEE